MSDKQGDQPGTGGVNAPIKPPTKEGEQPDSQKDIKPPTVAESNPVGGTGSDARLGDPPVGTGGGKGPGEGGL